MGWGTIWDHHLELRWVYHLEWHPGWTGRAHRGTPHRSCWHNWNTWKTSARIVSFPFSPSSSGTFTHTRHEFSWEKMPKVDGVGWLVRFMYLFVGWRRHVFLHWDTDMFFEVENFMIVWFQLVKRGCSTLFSSVKICLYRFTSPPRQNLRSVCW